MIVVPFELVIPGYFLKLPDRQESSQIEDFLRHLETCITDSALALGGYLESSNEVSRQSGRESWEQRQAGRRAVEAELGFGNGQGRFDRESYEEMRFRVDQVLFQRKCAAGIFPEAYMRRLPFLFARSFLFSVDDFRNGLGKLSGYSIASIVKPLLDEFDKTLPNLAGVRDSTAHVDERIQGNARKKKIELKPIDNGFIKAGGGVMVMGSLFNDNYTATKEDGHIGGVPVTGETLSLCVEILQRLLNALPWDGGKRLSPT